MATRVGSFIFQLTEKEICFLQDYANEIDFTIAEALHSAINKQRIVLLHKRAHAAARKHQCQKPNPSKSKYLKLR